MNPQLNHCYQLGATLYVPATHPQLHDVVLHNKYHLRSIVLCTEDAILEQDLEAALAALEGVLPHIQPSGMAVFVRPRNPEVLSRLLSLNGIDRVDGFVIPKADASSWHSWYSLLAHTSHWLMPTLETKQALDANAMVAFRDVLMGCQSRILALRIGGNDLLSLLGLRRVRGNTLYQSPLAYVASMLISVFKPYGFELTSPVMDIINDTDTLEREVLQDIAYGLIGKTAIHPSQIALIEALYVVEPLELEQVLKITHHNAPAVFKHQGDMCEPATHAAWAQAILRRAKVFAPTTDTEQANCESVGLRQFVNVANS